MVNATLQIASVLTNYLLSVSELALRGAEEERISLDSFEFIKKPGSGGKYLLNYILVYKNPTSLCRCECQLLPPSALPFQAPGQSRLFRDGASRTPAPFIRPHFRASCRSAFHISVGSYHSAETTSRWPWFVRPPPARCRLGSRAPCAVCAVSCLLHHAAGAERPTTSPELVLCCVCAPAVVHLCGRVCRCHSAGRRAGRIGRRGCPTADRTRAAEVPTASAPAPPRPADPAPGGGNYRSSFRRS